MGHGHVVPNSDGSRARCGGPAMCSVCAGELAAQQSDKQPWPSPENVVMMNTKQQQEMIKYINARAHGVNLKFRLEQAYREGWRAKTEAIKIEQPKEATK